MKYMIDELRFRVEFIRAFHWEKVKWIINGLYVLSTLMMISPEMASKSPLPWILYLIANAIWMIDSIVVKNKPWVWMAGFFVIWDAILILSRIFTWGI
jgi:hypothetical protein